MNNQILAGNCEVMAYHTADLPAGRATACERLFIFGSKKELNEPI